MAEEQHGTSLNYNREYTRWGISAFQKIVNGITATITTITELTNGTQKTQVVDESGNAIGSTNNSLNINDTTTNKPVEVGGNIESIANNASGINYASTGILNRFGDVENFPLSNTLLGRLQSIYSQLVDLYIKTLTNNSLLVSNPVTLLANYSSPEDGAVVYASSATLTASGFAFTVDSTNCNVMSVHVTNLAGTVTKYVNGHNGISLSATANVITIAGVTPFLATDTKYRVAIHYQEKAYDVTTDSYKNTIMNPDSSKTVEATSLVDTTNVAATTTYYPSTSGAPIAGYRHLCIQGITSGGVTTTIEVTNDPAVSPDWLDITKSFVELQAGTTATSYVDVSFILEKQMLNIKSFRIKSITSDASNAVQYSYRLQA